MLYKDIFHSIQFGAPLFSGVNVTASGKLGLVLDRRDLSDPDGDIIGLLVHVPVVTTADGANTMKIVLHEAAEKTDASTLTAGAIVNVGTGSQGEGSGSDSDVLGYTVDGARQVIANPAYDATVTATAQTELKFLQNGAFPLVNDVALAGSLYYFAYRGYEDCIQFFAEMVGTADITASGFYVVGSMSTRNVVNPPPNPAA